MTLQDYVVALRRHWLVIVTLTVVAAGIAFGYARTLPPEYSSTAAVMVVPQHGDNTSELVQGSNYVQSLVQTYTALASAPMVLTPVVKELGLDETPTQLATRVTAVNTLNTVIIEISVTDGDARQAQVIASSITASLVDAVGKVSPSDAQDQPAVRLDTIAPARMPQAPIGPNTRLIAMIGAAIGLVLGIGYALLRRVLGTRLNERDDIAAVTDAPLIGEIVAWRRNYTIVSTMLRSRDSRSAESFRGLAANLKYVAVDRDLRVVMTTSSAPHEGKSSVSIGLAAGLAESGHRVLVIDADLRRSAIATQLQLEEAVGVTSILVGEATFDEAVQHSVALGIDIIAGGTPAPNPGQLLSSRRLRDLVETARERYEYVIIDSAPALIVSDALLLADLADGVLVVARSSTTRRKQLAATLASLKSTHKEVVGVVLNAVKRKERGPYYIPETAARRRPKLQRRAKAIITGTAEAHPVEEEEVGVRAAASAARGV
ncbi:polysaccharide biosynthesis tyrosine autokinase [Microbacterium sp.]|uniref:polysaccharide biosynthesis tyrosine autokinase n=1 Tax=Microbacterium sp. TaxID=51671 RepID=UPI003A9457A2